MSFRSFLSELFAGKKAVNGVKSISISEHYTAVTAAQLQALAYYIAVDYIANTVTRVEWRTYLDGREVFGDEYYRLNVQPNINRSAADFWADVVRYLYNNPDTGALILPYDRSLILAETWNVNTATSIMASHVYNSITYNGETIDRKYNANDVITVDFGEDCNYKSLLRGYCDTYEDVMKESINKYKVADGERGILQIDTMSTGNKDDNERYKDLLDNQFETYFAAKNAVLPLYDGEKYTATRNSQSQKTSIVQDITALSAEIFAKTGQTLKVPPALMTGTTADISGAVDNYITFCIAPLVKKIAASLNRVLYGREVLNGSKIVPDLTAVRNVSAFDMAEKIDKLISDGIYSVNEVRRKLGEPRINEKWADEHQITKNYETAGGGGNGKKLIKSGDED